MQFFHVMLEDTSLSIFMDLRGRKQMSTRWSLYHCRCDVMAKLSFKLKFNLNKLQA